MIKKTSRRRPRSDSEAGEVVGFAPPPPLAFELMHQAYSQTGAPVLGFHIYAAAQLVLTSLHAKKEYRRIKVQDIGTPAVISLRPGISQTELAQILGVERATAGLHVARCVRLGWVRRELAADDRRRFSLHLTPAGRKMLAETRALIARHERDLGAPLEPRERVLLAQLLKKLFSR